MHRDADGEVEHGGQVIQADLTESRGPDQADVVDQRGDRPGPQALRENPFGLIRVGEVRREERPGVLTRALPRDADGMVPAGGQPGRRVETDSLRPTGDQDSFRRHIGSFREWPDSAGACA
jgi:hypothetical protein